MRNMLPLATYAVLILLGWLVENRSHSILQTGKTGHLYSLSKMGVHLVGTYIRTSSSAQFNGDF